MDERTAEFEIESKTDARAIERLLDRLYDSLREESRTLREGSSDSTTMLEQFEAVRDATRDHSTGTLRITYEAGEPFEE
jgi:uncharacterized membrane protein